MNKLSILAATLVLTAAAGAAQAQVISQRSIGLELANRLAAGGVQACADKGYAVSATVVDRAGLVRAVQRADNAGPHTLAASQQKAFTSASVGTLSRPKVRPAKRRALMVSQWFSPWLDQQYAAKLCPAACARAPADGGRGGDGLGWQQSREASGLCETGACRRTT